MFLYLLHYIATNPNLSRRIKNSLAPTARSSAVQSRDCRAEDPGSIPAVDKEIRRGRRDTPTVQAQRWTWTWTERPGD